MAGWLSNMSKALPKIGSALCSRRDSNTRLGFASFEFERRPPVQTGSISFNDAALHMRSDDIVAAWDAGHITGGELRMLASLFFDEFAEVYLADVHGCSVEEMRGMVCDDRLAPPFLAIPLVRLAANIELLLAHAAECRTADKMATDPDEVSDAMFAWQDEMSKIIHAPCANPEIDHNYPLYATRFYRLVQRVTSVLIVAGGDAERFAVAIADAQQVARDIWTTAVMPTSVTGSAFIPCGARICVPLFDVGAHLLRNDDIIAAWDQGLMTWRELRMLAELFYAENAAFVLATAYGCDADEMHSLWNGEGLADPFLGVPLARFADKIDTVIRLAQDYAQLAHSHWHGKASGEEVDVFRARHNTTIEAIAYAPLACDEVYADQDRYRASLNSLYPPIWVRAQNIGYDAAYFAAAIAKAQRGDL